MFEGWRTIKFDSNVGPILARHRPPDDKSVGLGDAGGRDALPLLLLHGHPQSHVMWHRVAPELTRRHPVVMMDLPGYGDSARPAPAADSLNPYSKRSMAQVALDLMAHLGFAHFGVLAHDRGARVAHRLAADAPEAVDRLLLLDIAPTLGMYERTSQTFATLYWHWFFLIQPAPMPETFIDADPVRYIRNLMGARHGGLQIFDPRALAEYERCVQIPGSAMAMCEDYRCAAGVDLEHDREDITAGRRLTQPLRVLWGQHGAVHRCFDVLALWRERASQVSGRHLPCGHYIAEEAPQLLLDEAMAFFAT